MLLGRRKRETEFREEMNVRREEKRLVEKKLTDCIHKHRGNATYECKNLMRLFEEKTDAFVDLRISACDVANVRSKMSN